MNKSTLFTQAHKLVKSIIKSGDDYKVTFGACVRFVLEKLSSGTVNAQENSVTLSNDMVVSNKKDFDLEKQRCIVEIDGVEHKFAITQVTRVREKIVFRMMNMKPVWIAVTSDDLANLINFFENEIAQIKKEERVKTIKKQTEVKKNKADKVRKLRSEATLLGLPKITKGTTKQKHYAEQIRNAYFNQTKEDRINQECLTADSAVFWIDNYKHVLHV